MPIYEYRCCECGQIFEEWQKEHKALDLECPVCGGKSEHIISNTSFVLKGSGWYVTDYARGNSSASSCSGGNGNGNGKKDKTETKSESKSESKPSAKSESKSSNNAQA